MNKYDTKKQTTALNFFMPANKTIPVDLVPKLMKFVPEPKESLIKTETNLPDFVKNDDFEIPLYVRETERAALYEFPAVLRLVEQGKISISEKKRFPTGSAIKHVTKVLYGDEIFTENDLSETRRNVAHNSFYAKDLKIEPIKSTAWALLLQAGKFVRKSGTKLALSKAGKDALLAANLEVALQRLFDNWTASDLFDEFNRINSVKGQTGKGKRGMTPPSWRKLEICNAIMECPMGQWISIAEFSKFMRAADYSFEITDNPWTLYIGEPRYGCLGYSGYHDWSVLQERYIKCIIMEYLATLGIVDIAYVHPADAPHGFSDIWGSDDLLYLSRYDGLLYFRVTNLGAYCTGVVDEYETPDFGDSEHIEVSSNFEITVETETIPPADLLVLENFTEKQSDYLWKISRKKLFEAYEKGHSLDDFRTFLEANSANELPKTVVHVLQEVKERSGFLKDQGMVRLITCNSLDTAELIANDSKTRGFCMHAGAANLIVPVKDEKKFMSALRTIGFAFKSHS